MTDPNTPGQQPIHFGYEPETPPTPYTPPSVQLPNPAAPNGQVPYGQQYGGQPTVQYPPVNYPVAPQQYPQQTQYPAPQPQQPVYPPQYAQQPYVPQQAQHPAQQYPQSIYNSPYATPQPYKSKAPAIVLGIVGFLILGFILLIVIANIYYRGVPSANSYEPPVSAPQSESNGGFGTDPNGWDTGVDDGTVTSDGAGSYEEGWKNGEGVDEPPAGVTPPTQFTTYEPDVNKWLDEQTGFNVDEEVTVVITNDASVNCGYVAGAAFGGCYKHGYGKTLFVWWSADATDEQKEFMVLHEYSHYIQNYDHLDALLSAVDGGLATDEEFLSMMEADATCRVYYGWGYDQYTYLDNQISAPCGDTDWYEDWFDDQVEDMGIVIEDW